MFIYPIIFPEAFILLNSLRGDGNGYYVVHSCGICVREFRRPQEPFSVSALTHISFLFLQALLRPPPALHSWNRAFWRYNKWSLITTNA